MIQIAIFSALFTVFLDFCMNEGNIFCWYYRLISKLPDWLNKPLGTCVFCFGTWVFIVLYLCSVGICFGKTSDFVALFGGLGINHIVIRIADKYL